MAYVGKGNIRDLIKAPGDYGWQHGLRRVQVDGIWRDEVANLQFAHYCPKNGACFQDVTRDAAVHPNWHWDGNEETPTITPSINCDRPLRCGWHVTVTAGVFQYADRGG